MTDDYRSRRPLIRPRKRPRRKILPPLTPDEEVEVMVGIAREMGDPVTEAERAEIRELVNESPLHC